MNTDGRKFMNITQALDHQAKVAAERTAFNQWWQFELKTVRFARWGERQKMEHMLAAWRAWLAAKGLG
jgi:hypothetical protein